MDNHVITIIEDSTLLSSVTRKHKRDIKEHKDINNIIRECSRIINIKGSKLQVLVILGTNIHARVASGCDTSICRVMVDIKVFNSTSVFTYDSSFLRIF